jgi:hypothetical protein
MPMKTTTMSLGHNPIFLAGFAASLMLIAQTQAAVISNPTITNSPSQFDGSYAATNLFDGTPTFGAGTTLGSQWAGSGVGPHTIEFNFGAPKSIGWLGYAQRAGSNPALDKVTSIQFTYSNAPDFSAATTSTLTVTNTANSNYWAYNLGATFSAQYVRAVFTGSGGNPGGSELRFYEPARQALANPTITGSASQFSPAFAASFLFDGVGEAGLNANNEQWAGSGPGPHTLNFDFGSGVSVDTIGYAQRAGGIPTTDKVISMDLFFSDVDGVFSPTPTTTLAITNTTNNLFIEYSLGASYSGRYLKAIFTGNGGNPGGSELRFYGAPVPEPSQAVLGFAACCGLLMRRRR